MPTAFEEEIRSQAELIRRRTPLGATEAAHVAEAFRDILFTNFRTCAILWRFYPWGGVKLAEGELRWIRRQR